MLLCAPDAIHRVAAALGAWLLFLIGTCGPGIAAAGAFDGAYRGALNGVPASLLLESEGSKVEGLLQIEGGLPTVLQGEIAGGTARGQAGNLTGLGTFVATPSNGALTLDLTAASSQGGRSPCEWKSNDEILHLRDPGGAWQAVGRYAIDDSQGVMLQYLPNGDRRLWYRQ